MPSTTHPGMTLLLILAAALLAGSPASAADPEVVGGLPRVDAWDSTLAIIDVFVADDSDTPVTGLERERFKVLQDGTPMELTHFQALTDESSTDSTPTVVPEADATVRPVYLVYFIDNAHLRHQQRNRLLSDLQHFTREIMGGTVQVMVLAHHDSLEIVQPFTVDARDVVHGLRGLKLAKAALDEHDEEHDRVQREIRRAAKTTNSSPAGRAQILNQLYESIQAYAQDEARTLEGTVQSLNDAINMLSGLNGRGYLLYVSCGLPMVLGKDLLFEFADIDRRTSTMAVTMPFNKQRYYEGVAATATSQGISIYAIDASGGEKPSANIGDSDSPRSTASPGLRLENDQAPLELLADKTGGLALLRATDGDFAPAFARLKADLLTYYSLGYLLPSTGEDRVHEVEVSIDGGEDYELRYRRTMVERSIPSRVQETATSALTFAIDHNPLGIEVRTGPLIKATELQWRMEVEVTVPVASIALTRDGDDYVGHALLAAALRHSESNRTDGHRERHELRVPVSQYPERRDGSFTVTRQLLVEGGSHDLVVGVLDETSRQVSYAKLEITTD